MSRPRCSEFVWVQRDGTPIHVRKMSDEHLLNTIRLLRRWSVRVAEEWNAQESIGVWDAEDAKSCYFVTEDQFAERHPTWAALQFERRVRGLEELL